MTKKKIIYSLFFYIVLALLFIILKDEMLSIVANSISDSISYITVSRLYYILLLIVLLLYVFLFKKNKIKGKLNTCILLFLGSIYFLSIIHSLIYPFQSNSNYIIILLPLLIYIFMADLTIMIDQNKFNQVILFVFALLVFYYIKSYDMRSEVLSALTSSSAYAILYFLPLVLCRDNKIIKYSVIIVTFIVILFSYKRAGIIALSSSIIIYSFIDGIVSNHNRFKTSRIKRILLLIFICVVCYFLFTGIDAEYDNRLIGRFQSISEDKGSGRVDVYDYTWNMISGSDLINLLFGHGWNSVLRDSPLMLSAHNDFLEILYDFGIIVLLIYLITIVQLFKYAILLFKLKSKYAAPFWASLIIFFINSMVSHIIIYPNYMCIFTFFWAYVYSKNYYKLI